MSDNSCGKTATINKSRKTRGQRKKDIASSAMDQGGSEKTAAMESGGSEKTDATIKIEKLIESIRPEDDHTKAEGLIRRIDKTINALPSDEKGKKLLENKLEDVALNGLDEELQEIMKIKGLALEGLPLVREYLTTKPDLASFFFENKGIELNPDLKKIQRKIGPQLEVLGELIHRGFDPSDEKVKDLVKKASSRSKLRKMRDNKELPDFGKEEENIEAAINDVVSPKENTLEAEKMAAEKKKKEQEEKLKKAKELMDHAKRLADEGLKKNETAVNDKIKKMREILDLPSDLNQHLKENPNDMLKQLQSKIQTLGEFENSLSPYNSVEEIAANASGGLALKGIVYSHSGQPTTAKIPILKPPTKVNSWNAQSPFETGYRQFSDESSAASFSKEVESSGFTHADSVSVSYGIVSCKASVYYGSQSSREEQRSTKGSTTSVLTTHFCRSTMKCFAIPRHYMCLCDQACAMALKLSKPKVQRFFDIYGTHIPYSVHQLGGVFFSTSKANSTKQMQTSKLMQLNATKLTTQVSVGAYGGSWGVGVSDKHEQESSKGWNEAKEDEHKNVSYTFSVKSIGPHADTPASFKKALSTNNATWAVVDRGDTFINVPVWELLRECGEQFKESADLMEETWEEDEKKNIELKETAEEIEQQILNYTIMSQTGKQLLTHDRSCHHLPIRNVINKRNVAPVFSTYTEDVEEVKRKIVDFICESPDDHVCQLIEDTRNKQQTHFFLFGLRIVEGVLGFKDSKIGYVFHSTRSIKNVDKKPIITDPWNALPDLLEPHAVPAWQGMAC